MACEIVADRRTQIGWRNRKIGKNFFDRLRSKVGPLLGKAVEVVT
jgi:hypothetical protein